MTAAQLEHLAESNTDAADFYHLTDPAMARLFADAAHAATALAERQARAEQFADMRSALRCIKAAMA